MCTYLASQFVKGLGLGLLTKGVAYKLQGRVLAGNRTRVICKAGFFSGRNFVPLVMVEIADRPIRIQEEGQG